MRMFEMTKRPERAGLAELSYREGILYPERKGDRIIIPTSPALEFFFLGKGREQFVIIHGPQVWFGGTDEMPFLVRLSEEAGRNLLSLNGGAAKFYDCLVPPVIREMKRFTSTGYKRQGDIFALPVGYSWKTIRLAAFVTKGRSIQCSNTPPGGIKMFETRHMLVGGGLHDVTMFGRDGLSLVEGVVTAPDHSPMELHGPHIVSQTYGLYDPPNAD